jgi:hypothetical protein
MDNLKVLLDTSQEKPWLADITDGTIAAQVRSYRSRKGEGQVIEIWPVSAGFEPFTPLNMPLPKMTSRATKALLRTIAAVHRGAWRLPNKEEQSYIGGNGDMCLADILATHVNSGLDFFNAAPGTRIFTAATLRIVTTDAYEEVRETYWQPYGRGPKAPVSLGRHPGDDNLAQGMHGMYWELLNGRPLRGYASYEDNKTFPFLVALMTQSIMVEQAEAQEAYLDVVIPVGSIRRSAGKETRQYLRENSVQRLPRGEDGVAEVPVKERKVHIGDRNVTIKADGSIWNVKIKEGVTRTIIVDSQWGIDQVAEFAQWGYEVSKAK